MIVFVFEVLHYDAIYNISNAKNDETLQSSHKIHKQFSQFLKSGKKFVADITRKNKFKDVRDHQNRFHVVMETMV